MSKHDPKPLTPEERAEAVRLCDAATAGPWERVDYGNGIRHYMGSAGLARVFYISSEGIVDCVAMRESDEAFVLSARTLLPRYEATVKALEERANRFKEALKSLCWCDDPDTALICPACEAIDTLAELDALAEGADHES